MTIYVEKYSRIYLVEKSLYLDWVGMRRSWLGLHFIDATAFIKPSHSLVFPSCVHPPSPKRCFSGGVSSWLKSSGLLGPVVQMCHGMWLRCSFPVCYTSSSPSSGRTCQFRSLTSMSKFLFKVLLSMANLGYLFNLIILSTSEETLAHQIGGKALGWAASVCLFCFLELNTFTLTHPHLPTPHQGALFPSLS